MQQTLCEGMLDSFQLHWTDICRRDIEFLFTVNPQVATTVLGKVSDVDDKPFFMFIQESTKASKKGLSERKKLQYSGDMIKSKVIGWILSYARVEAQALRYDSVFGKSLCHIYYVIFDDAQAMNMSIISFLHHC